MSIRRERRRLGRAFQVALLAAGGPAIVLACSTSGPGEGSTNAGPSGSHDATLDTFVPPGADAEAGGADAGSPPADAAPATDGPRLPPFDAGPDGGCYAGSYELDAGPDADGAADICVYLYECGLSGTGLGNEGCQVLQVVAGGQLAPIPQTLCWLVEDAGCDDDAFAPGPAGAVTIACTPCPTGGGRRPAGLRKPPAPRRPRAKCDLGAYLALLAFEEDASTAAFARMGAELAALGAPAALVSAAARATQDEARHQRAMATLACARGATRAEIARARVRRARGRRAAAVASENAGEGCVRETYGALVARWQSIHAQDPDVRHAFARIAADEARHAALSWAVARWIEPTLDAAGARRVARSRARALRALRASVVIEPPAPLARAAGLPSAREARALLATMSRELGLFASEDRAEPRGGTSAARATLAARPRSPRPAAPSP